MNRALLLAGVVILTMAGKVWSDQPIQAKAPGGGTIAVAKDTTITVTDVATNKALMMIKAHKDPITALGYAPDGKLLVSADKNGTVNLFDLATGKQLWKSQVGVGITSLKFSNNGKTLEATDNTNRTRTLDVLTGKVVK